MLPLIESKHKLVQRKLAAFVGCEVELSSCIEEGRPPTLRTTKDDEFEQLASCISVKRQ